MQKHQDLGQEPIDRPEALELLQATSSDSNLLDENKFIFQLSSSDL